MDRAVVATQGQDDLLACTDGGLGTELIPKAEADECRKQESEGDETWSFHVFLFRGLVGLDDTAADLVAIDLQKQEICAGREVAAEGIALRTRILSALVDALHLGS